MLNGKSKIAINYCTYHVIHTQVYDILQRIQYAKGSDQIGLGRLLGNRSFNNAFPLHDVSHLLLLWLYYE